MKNALFLLLASPVLLVLVLALRFVGIMQRLTEEP